VEELDQVEYRGEGKLVAVIPKTTFKLLLFELDGPDRASWTIEGKNCTLHRVGAAGRGATAAAPSPAPTSAPSAVPAAANAPAAASSSAVISLAAAIGSIADGRPLANSAVFILRHDAETALRQGGVQARPGMTVLQTWAAECQQRTPLCQKGVQGLQAAGIGILRTDAQGRGQTPSLPPGTYYVVASYREAGLERFWNLRVDVKPGLNNVTLDRRNMVTP
jgi:hypothetical protein